MTLFGEAVSLTMLDHMKFGSLAGKAKHSAYFALLCTGCQGPPGGLWPRRRKSRRERGISTPVIFGDHGSRLLEVLI